MCTDDDDDESIFKFKKEYVDMQDKIDNKIDIINKVINIIKKMEDKFKKNIESIYKILLLFELRNLRIGQAEINTINAKIDDALNFVCNNIYRKNRKNRIISEKIIKYKLDLLE